MKEFRAWLAEGFIKAPRVEPRFVREWRKRIMRSDATAAAYLATHKTQNLNSAKRGGE